MPRSNRINTAGFLHHVICRGNDKQVIFRTVADFKYYLSLVDKARHLYPINIYNYVLMNNHIHLLVEPKEDGSLSKFMEYVSKEYAKYFNKTHDRTGHVFQGRFKSFIVQFDRYFYACSRYIDLNPLNAGVVKDPATYVWSGYSSLAFGEKGRLVLDKHDLYTDLGKSNLERQIAYRTLVLRHQGDDLELMDRRAGILGDKAFKNKVKENVI